MAPSNLTKTSVRLVFHRLCRPCFLIGMAAWLVAGCAPSVHMPITDQFNVVSGQQTQRIDAEANGGLLLQGMYELLKANEGEVVPVCTATEDTKECLHDGVRVFVMGGVIPGAGSRSCYVFSDVTLEERQLAFSKDNRKTKFIGTPMFTKGNQCKAYIGDGGIQVEMTKYYACWAAIGHCTMAEAWAIDFIDFQQGLVGMQLELDIKGIMVAGGGSRYVLLKFPNVPDSFTSTAPRFQFSGKTEKP